MQNSINNGTQEQKKQMVLNLIQNKFKFYEDMTDAEKQTVNNSINTKPDRNYKKSDLPNIKSVTVDETNKNSVTINMDKMNNSNDKKYIYSPYTKSKETFFKETTINGDNQKITIALTPETNNNNLLEDGTNTNNTVFLKSKVFKSIDDLINYNFENKNNVSSYFGYVDVGNGKCSLYLVSSINETENINIKTNDGTKPSPYASKANIQYYIDTTIEEQYKNKFEAFGYQIKINPIQITTKFVI